MDFFVIIFNLVLQCHLVSILFYDLLTLFLFIFGGQTIHRKYPHKKLLRLDYATSQKLNPLYCLFPPEIWLFWNHASKKKNFFFKFLSKINRLADFDATTKCSIVMVNKCPLPICDILIREFCPLDPKIPGISPLCCVLLSI